MTTTADHGQGRDEMTATAAKCQQQQRCQQQRNAETPQITRDNAWKTHESAWTTHGKAENDT